jgi:spore germination protein KA
MRWLAFMLAAAFPGIYLAAVNHDPEMLPLKLLLNLAAGEKTTLLSLFTELVVIMLLLEILREASIRLPHAIGTAMSIAGGLIIGDTAVKSGIISSPLLIIVGVTATASFVLPSFSQQLSVLRLMFIFAGGFAGFFGISACAVMLSANICSQSLDGVPFSSPAAPFNPDGMSEMLGRKTFRRMEKDEPTTKDLK